jgi:subfamily B ATP-binding cassette protein MsbA
MLHSKHLWALRKLLFLVKPYWPKLALAVFCMIGVSAFTALTAYLIKPAMDDIFVKQNLEMLKLMPLLILVVFFFKGIFQWGNDNLLQSVGLSVVTSLRQRLYEHIQDMPLSFFDRTSTGTLMSRITNDVAEIQAGATKAVTGVIRDSFTVVGLIGVVFYQNWKLALIATCVLPLAFYPLFSFGSKLRRLATRRQETMADLNVVLHETIGGVRVVKAFGMENYEKARFGAKNDQVLRYNLKFVWIDALASPLMEFIGAIGIAAIIGYGGYQVVQGISTPGTFFSFLGGILMLYRPIKNLSRVNSLVQKGIASIVRVQAILDEKRDLTEKLDAVELPRVGNSIEIRRVDFAYNTTPENLAEDLVLHDINLKVSAGEVVALVGNSGGGKTTLVNLLCRFYDVSSGAILIDGIDIRDVTFRSLRSQIAIVTQQSFLFNDTICNNIAYGSFEKPEEDIISAAKAAYAYDFITQLPQGFDTMIGEQGVRLSGGQRQRICIARALLKDAPILILDEATSSLDSESEQEVQRALENLMRGRTTFIIAHRLSTIQAADRILVICNGKIVEEGSHNHLLSCDGEYRKLYEIQFHP